MLKTKKFLSTLLLIMSIFACSFFNQGKAYALQGLITDSNDVRWTYTYTPLNGLAIAYFDRPETMTTVVVPSLSELLDLVPEADKKLDTYLIKDSVSVGTTETKRTPTKNVTTLDLTKTTKSQIYGFNDLLNKDTEVNIIFGDHMVFMNEHDPPKNAAYSKGAFSGLKVKITNFEKGAYFGARTFKNTTFNEANRDLVLTKEQTMGQQAFMHTNIKSLDVNSIDIGGGAFMDCMDLTSVKFGEDVTNIWGEAFWGTQNLVQDIKMPNKVTKAEYAIFYNSGITSVNLNNVKEVRSHAFTNSGLTSVNFGKTETIGYVAFSGTNLGDLDFSTTNVKTIGTSSFENAGVTSVKLDGVESIKHKGLANNKLTELTLPKSIKDIWESNIVEDNKITKVTVEYDMLLQDNRGVFFSILGYNTSKYVTDLKIVAPYKDNEPVMAGHININNEYDYTKNPEVGCYSYSCPNIKNYYQDLNTFKNVIPYNYFYGMDNVKNLEIGEGYEVIGPQAFIGNWYSNSIKTAKLPSTLKVIGSLAFYRQFRDEGSTVNLPDALEYIGSEAFMETTGLTFDFDSKNVRVLGFNAFYASRIHNLTLRDKIEYFHETAFFYNPNIHDVTIDFDIYGTNGMTSGKPHEFMYFGDIYGVNSNTTDHYGHEYGNIKYTSKAKTQPIYSDSMYYHFMDGIKADVIDFSETPWKELGNSALLHATANEIKLPKNLKTIGSYGLYNIRIDKIDLPETLEYIGVHGLSHTKAEITKLPANLKVIERNAFYDDENLKASFDLKQVEKIDESAFNNTKLTDVLINNTVKYLGKNAFYGIPTLKNVTIDTDVYGSGIYHGGYETFVFDFGIKGQDWENITFTENVKTEPCGNDFTKCTTSRNSYFFGINADTIDLSKTDWKHLGPSMFQESNINTLKLPENLDTIYTSSFYEASLSNELVVPDTVKNIGRYAFQWSNLTIDQLPESLEKIDYAGFYGAQFNDNPVVPKTVNYIGGSAFNAGDIDVHFDSFTFDNDMKMDNTSGQTIETMLYGADIDELIINSAMLPVLSIGSDKSEFYAMPMDKVVLSNIPSITPNAFKNCANLKEVDLSENKNLNSIQFNAFLNNELLDTISFSPELKGKDVTLEAFAFANTGFKSVGDDKNEFDLTAANFDAKDGYVFSNMKKLVTAYIPYEFSNGTVPAFTFFNDIDLERVDISNNIKTIGQGAFANDTKLDEFIFWGHNTEIVDKYSNTLLINHDTVAPIVFVNENIADDFSMTIQDNTRGTTIVEKDDFNDDGTYIYGTATGEKVKVAISGGTAVEGLVAAHAKGINIDPSYTTYSIMSESDAETIPENSNIYAYSTSKAEKFAGSEDRKEYSGKFYLLDEVLYLTTNKQITELTNDNTDFNKDDLIIYALRRDGVVLESNSWRAMSDVHKLDFNSEEPIKFNYNPQTATLSSRVYNAPMKLADINLDNENFEEMQYRINLSSKDSDIVDLIYKDKYTSAETFAKLHTEKFAPLAPNTGIIGALTSATTNNLTIIIAGASIIVIGTILFIKKRRV